MAKKQKSVSKLKKELDRVFSEYIRKRDMDCFGNAVCVTCGKKDHWKNMQAGHYCSRSHLATRYSEKNVAVQCVGCNIFKNGNMPAYTIFLQNKYGHGIVEELYRESKKITKYFPYELTIEKYQRLLDNWG